MLKNTCVDIFLQDVKQNSEVIILEQASKERKELIEMAKKRGIIIAKDDKDLGVLKGIYCFTDLKNSNNQQVPTDEIIKALPGIVGKPMNINHIRDFIVGFFIGYDFIMKKKTAIVYSIFFKSNYPKLWEKIKKLHKAKKLSHSFELWADEKKKKILSNGVEELHSISTAGGALILEEDGITPAFEKAKVLEIAMKDYEKIIDNKYLVYASKHKNDEIITCKNGICTSKKLEKGETMTEETKTITKDNVNNLNPNVPSIICQNCNESIVISFPQNEIKCPKCKAILDMNGTMIAPPQNIDFHLLCPSCKINNWRILSSTDNKTKVRCSCGKEYELTFKEETIKEATDKDLFKKSLLYEGKITCIQCGEKIEKFLNSSTKSKSITCPKCGITFIINKKDAKKINRVQSIREIEKSSVNGGKDNMEISKEILDKVKAEEAKAEKSKDKEEAKESKAEKKENTAVEADKKEAKVEEKKDEAKAEEAKSEETSKTEEKAEEKKVEEKPKEEAKEKPTKKDEKIGEAIFAKDSSKVKDKKEHFNIKDINQANKVSAMVDQFDKIPAWYSGTLEELKEDVKTTIAKKFPKKKKAEKVECSCVDCGNKVTSEEHCINLKCSKCGGEMRRASRPGNGKPQEKKTKSTKTLRKAVKKIKDIEIAKKEVDETNTKFKEGIRKLAKQLIEAKAEIKNIKKASEEKVSFYEKNAKTLYDRKEELGEYAEGLSDEKIMNEDAFAIAKLTKERDDLAGKKIEKASEIVGDKTNKDKYKLVRAKVDEYCQWNK